MQRAKISIVPWGKLCGAEGVVLALRYYSRIEGLAVVHGARNRVRSVVLVCPKSRISFGNCKVSGLECRIVLRGCPRKNFDNLRRRLCRHRGCVSCTLGCNGSLWRLGCNESECVKRDPAHYGCRDKNYREGFHIGRLPV